jgi:hypothetical protein
MEIFRLLSACLQSVYTILMKYFTCHLLNDKPLYLTLNSLLTTRYYLPLYILLFSCTPNDETAPALPIISIVSAYSANTTKGEANVILSTATPLCDEVGIVWSEQSNLTNTGNRQTLAPAKGAIAYTIPMSNLQIGKIYYVKAYYTLNGTTTYSNEQISFIHNFSSNWTRQASPTLDVGRYVLADGTVYSGSQGGLAFYAVDKNTNVAKQTIFYQGEGQWDIKYYYRPVSKDAPMRFNAFNASFQASGKNLTLIGGGYYKGQDEQKFYLKDFQVNGISGYLWEPPYPGADVITSSFGLDNHAFILENSANGKLWRYSTYTYSWEAVGSVPEAKGAKFVSFDIGERAFVLVESDNWNDDLSGFYEYLPLSKQWKKKATFKGENRRRGIAFTLEGKIYYGAGQSTKTLQALRDIWTYDPANDIWKKTTDYPGAGTVNLVSVPMNGYAYIGFGQQAIANADKGESFFDATDFWLFKP